MDQSDLVVTGAVPVQFMRRPANRELRFMAPDGTTTAFTVDLAAGTVTLADGWGVDEAAALFWERVRALGTVGRARTEIAREFIDPPYPDVPIPWPVEGFGEPDLSQPPPGSGGHPMRWVRRTVTYGPWQPVPDDETKEK